MLCTEVILIGIPCQLEKGTTTKLIFDSLIFQTISVFIAIGPEGWQTVELP